MPDLWAPLVHSRTFSADFRHNYIVRPDDFTNQEIKWSKKFVTGTTLNANRLGEEGMRWAVFTSEKHVVVGVTCRAQAIRPEATDYHADERGRLVYMFLGYVAHAASDLTLPARDTKLFAPLFGHVIERWKELYFEAERDVTAPYAAVSGWTGSTPHKHVDFNLKPDEVQLLSSTNPDPLWQTAAHYAQTQDPFSLCMSLASEPEAVTSVFGNVSLTAAVAEPYTISRTVKQQILEEISKPRNRTPTKETPVRRTLPADDPTLYDKLRGIVARSRLLLSKVLPIEASTSEPGTAEAEPSPKKKSARTPYGFQKSDEPPAEN